MDRAAHILVVEDEPIILLDLVDILERAGFLVVPASSIEQALGRLDQVPIDAATLDSDLHGVSTAPIAQRLHELKIPYVVCSAYPLGYYSWTRQVVHITKPVAADVMVGAVRTAVASRTARDTPSG